jgi:subtilase family serine protease
LDHVNVTDAALPDLALGLIRIRDARDRPAEEGAGILAHVAELTATVHNRGDALADETTTRFWVRGPDIDRELRAVYTPPIPSGEEVEVTALWDVRGRRGSYVITVTADAFSQIAEARKDDNFASINVAVRDNHVEPI